jgi:hypothetical protein
LAVPGAFPGRNCELEMHGAFDHARGLSACAQMGSAGRIAIGSPEIGQYRGSVFPADLPGPRYFLAVRRTVRTVPRRNTSVRGRFARDSNSARIIVSTQKLQRLINLRNAPARYAGMPSSCTSSPGCASASTQARPLPHKDEQAGIKEQHAAVRLDAVRLDQFAAIAQQEIRALVGFSGAWNGRSAEPLECRRSCAQMVTAVASPHSTLFGSREHWLKVLHTSNARGEKPVSQCIEMGEVRFQECGEFPSTDLGAARLAVVAFWGWRGGCRL